MAEGNSFFDDHQPGQLYRHAGRCTGRLLGRKLCCAVECRSRAGIRPTLRSLSRHGEWESDVTDDLRLLERWHGVFREFGTRHASSSATDGELISAATTTSFFYREPRSSHADDWNYRSGVLQLLAEDDSEVILDADTGDDTTVSIRLNGEAGAEQFIQPWSLWQSVLRRAP